MAPSSVDFSIDPRQLAAHSLRTYSGLQSVVSVSAAYCLKKQHSEKFLPHAADPLLFEHQNLLAVAPFQLTNPELVSMASRSMEVSVAVASVLYHLCFHLVVPPLGFCP